MLKLLLVMLCCTTTKLCLLEINYTAIYAQYLAPHFPFLQINLGFLWVNSQLLQSSSKVEMVKINTDNYRIAKQKFSQEMVNSNFEKF